MRLLHSVFRERHLPETHPFNAADVMVYLLRPRALSWVPGQRGCQSEQRKCPTKFEFQKNNESSFSISIFPDNIEDILILKKKLFIAYLKSNLSRSPCFIWIWLDPAPRGPRQTSASRSQWPTPRLMILTDGGVLGTKEEVKKERQRGKVWKWP